MHPPAARGRGGENVGVKQEERWRDRERKPKRETETVDSQKEIEGPNWGGGAGHWEQDCGGDRGRAGSRGQGKGCLFLFFTGITDAQSVSEERMQVFHVKKGKSRLSDRVT